MLKTVIFSWIKLHEAVCLMAIDSNVLKRTTCAKSYHKFMDKVPQNHGRDGR